MTKLALREPTCTKSAVERSLRLSLALAALIVVLAVLSLMVGPAGLSPRVALGGLFSGEGPAGIIVRDIRLPRTLLVALIGTTLGLSGAALQGLLRNPLAEPALFGAPQAAAAAAALVIAFGLAPVTSFAVPGKKRRVRPVSSTTAQAVRWRARRAGSARATSTSAAVTSFRSVGGMPRRSAAARSAR